MLAMENHQKRFDTESPSAGNPACQPRSPWLEDSRLTRFRPLAITCLAVAVCLALADLAKADDKATALRGSPALSTPDQPAGPGRVAVGGDGKFAIASPGGTGHRTAIGEGDHRYPVVVVRGTPYQMGWQLGNLIRDEMQRFIPKTVAGLANQVGLSTDTLVEAWTRSSAYADDRVEQELLGVADASGVPLRTLQAMHALPLLMPYSCSSIAAWGEATEDGHLYQTRNLDWNLEVRAHDFPVIVVYVPDEGIPHVVPTFAGMIGAHTGMNLHGIALSEMGDASAKEAPYQVHAPHFTVFFRSMLYDSDSLTRAIEIFEAQPPTKRYHYVFGDGGEELRAVKVRAHASEPVGQRLKVWRDNDPTDEFAPNVLRCLVYNDEGRGAFPSLQKDFGKLNGERMIALANQIPIRGGNVENVVYDATGLRMWVSYAQGDREAYLRPYAFLDLKTLDADGNGRPDLQ